MEALDTLTVAEAAKILKKSKKTLQNWICLEKIPVVRMFGTADPIILKSDLEDIVLSFREGPKVLSSNLREAASGRKGMFIENEKTRIHRR